MREWRSAYALSILHGGGEVKGEKISLLRKLLYRRKDESLVDVKLRKGN